MSRNFEALLRMQSARWLNVFACVRRAEKENLEKFLASRTDSTEGENQPKSRASRQSQRGSRTSSRTSRQSRGSRDSSADARASRASRGS